MEDEIDGGPGPAGGVAIGFVVLALMFGPVASYVGSSFAAAVQWQVLACGAVASAIAGCGLLAAGVICGERLTSARQWLPLGVLLMPRVLDGMLGAGALRLHETGWGVALLVAVAAPLWLGLLSALRMIAVDVPRALVAAGIVGVGAVLLVIPTDAYAVVVGQVPMLVVKLLLGVATVFCWWFVRQRLAGAAVLPMAGMFLLMSAAVSGVSSLMVDRAGWQPVDWRDAAVPVLVQAGLAAASCWVWFYVLVRMRLTGFVMHPLAVWGAGIVWELVGVRFAAWRMDVSAVIAIAAIAVGARARILDEQPTALGLGET